MSDVPAARRAEREEIWTGRAPPAVVFDRVSLAFDDKVILDEVTFTLLLGHTKLSWAPAGPASPPCSGSSWAAQARLRRDLGERRARGGMGEAELMRVRAHLGMVFQEGALFDSLTVRENVGFKLYEETRLPSRRWTRGWRRCSGSWASASTSTRCPRSCRAGSGGAWRSPAR